MPRIRTIKPEFFTDRKVAELRHTTRLTMIGLLTYVDDAGRGPDDARLIKAAIWPIDDKHTVGRVERDLDDLEKAGIVERYLHDGDGYLRMRHFWRHQNVNRARPSKYPPSPEEMAHGHHTHGPAFTEASVIAHCGCTDGSVQERKGTGKGTSPARANNSPPTPTASAEIEIDRCIAERALPASTAAKAHELAVRADALLRRNGRPPRPPELVDVVAWALTHLDGAFVDQVLGELHELTNPPRSVQYLATTLHQRASQAQIDMPEWRTPAAA